MGDADDRGGNTCERIIARTDDLGAVADVQPVSFRQFSVDVHDWTIAHGPTVQRVAKEPSQVPPRYTVESLGRSGEFPRTASAARSAIIIVGA